ncbi:TonB-dependent receptor [Sphingomonas sp. Root710]|uniref:TonB-dependent receptor n=1 Tax=Sphingomonas sp. Root710 TaxID=1736594 RepID=UPI000A983AE7|nr:TonB-dependent receptor [Sphingomonas sp. Root710]
MKRIFKLSASAIVLSMMSQPAFSQSRLPEERASEATTSSNNEAAIADIVVTAQRRSERLQDVPIAVTAVTAEKLANVGITSAQDLSLVAPSLYLPVAAGSIQPRIRGVGTTSSGVGFENPVALYVDGVYIANAASGLLTLNNIERVEVLKGPQGTLFGRNSTGGLIQVVTKDPKQTAAGSFNASFARFNDLTLGGYLTGGLGDKVAADLAVRYQSQAEGWGTNLATGKDVNRIEHDIAVRSKWLFEPDDATRIRFAVDYADRRDSMIAFHATPGYPLTFNNAFFGGPYDQGGRYDNNKDQPEIARLKTGGVSLQINHDIGSVAFQSITAYRKTRFNFDLDLDLTPIRIVACCGKTRAQQLSQEFQLSSTGAGPLKWVAGVYLWSAKDEYTRLDIILDNGLGFTPSGVTDIRDINAQRTKSAAAYAQGSYEILPDTTLTLGGRYTYERKTESGTENIYDGVNGPLFIAGPYPAAGIPTKLTFKRFNYRISLDHKFSPDILGYASYSTGFKSGGFNPSQAQNPPFNPEEIKAAEIGLKTQLFDRRLRFNVAAFHYDYSNIQVARFLNGTQQVTNGAKAENYGFDLDADLVVGGGLSFSGGLGYVHARFKSFPGADLYSGFKGCALPLGQFCSASAAGNQLPGVPAWTWNIGGEYRTDLGSGEIALNLTYSGVSKWFAAPDNYAFQPAYQLLNASIGWTDSSQHYSIRVWGKNLTNEYYAIGIFEANQGVNSELAAPRTYGATVGFKF